VKSFYETNTVKMVLSGSNSRLLKSEYTTLLSGRYIQTQVFPFSLAEIFAEAGLADPLSRLESRSKVLELVGQVLTFGSFPEVFKASKPFLKEELLISYYDTISLKDCLQDKPVRDALLLRELAAYLLANFARPYSYQSLSRALSSNENSIREYTSILEEAYLLDQLVPFSYSSKEYGRARKKAYPADNEGWMITMNQFMEPVPGIKVVPIWAEDWLI
jgi:uncharacterized protein